MTAAREKTKLTRNVYFKSYYEIFFLTLNMVAAWARALFALSAVDLTILVITSRFFFCSADVPTSSVSFPTFLVDSTPTGRVLTGSFFGSTTTFRFLVGLGDGDGDLATAFEAVVRGNGITSPFDSSILRFFFGVRFGEGVLS